MRQRILIVLRGSSRPRTIRRMQTRLAVALSAAGVMVVAGGGIAWAAHKASTPSYYYHSAREVAAAIGCAEVLPMGHDVYDIDSVRCTLAGHVVKIRTYGNPSGQKAWTRYQTGQVGPSFYWATAPGADVLAYDGDQAAADAAAAQLPGTVVHG